MYKNPLTAAVMVAHFWVNAQYLDRKQLRKRYNLLKTGSVPKLTLQYNTWHRDNTLPLQLPAWTGNPRSPCLCEPGAGAAVTLRENRIHTTCSPSELQHCHKFLSWKTRPASPHGAKWSQIFAFLFTSLKQLSDRKLSLWRTYMVPHTTASI